MTECPICFKKNADYTTDCNHTFCKKCLYKWKSTCPLCRNFIQLKYPNTRAMTTNSSVIDNTKILLENIARVKKLEYKIKYIEKLFNYLWDNRIVVRKYGNLCKTIRERAIHIRSECLTLGFKPPKNIEKMIII